jgi:hypothetical protein
MVNKIVFTLAAVMMALFLLVSGIDRFFFVLHFLESLVYLVMMVLLYYGLVEWGYVIGFLAPLFWSALNLLSGLLMGALGAMLRFEFSNPLAMVVGGMFFVGLVLVVMSWRAYQQEVWPSPGALRTVFEVVVILLVYYGVLAYAVWQMVRPAEG